MSTSNIVFRNQAARHLKKAGAAGAIILIYAFLLAPILIVVAISFNEGAVISFPPKGMTLDWYAAVFSNESFMDGLRISLIIAPISAILTLVLGIPIAFALVRKKFKGRDLISVLFLSPLMVPSIAVGLGLLIVLTQAGLFGTYGGLIIGHFGITVPYTVRTTMISLLSVNPQVEEAAETLGANKFQTFMRITLPLVSSGVIAGAAMAFLISFDEAVISLFIVGTDTTTLPVEMFRYVQFNSDPLIAALASILVIGTVVFAVVIERVMGLRRVLRS